MKTKFVLLAAACTLASLASPAYAGTFIANGSGLVSPGSTLTFSEVALADNTLVTNQFAASGVTFNNAVINAQDGILSRDYAANFGLGLGIFPDLTFTFTSSVTDAAFELVTNPGISMINIFLGGNLVDTAMLPTDLAAGSYYGYTGGLFDSVQILAPVNNALLIDNIQFNAAAADVGAVPEPATWALMIVGFGMIGATLRRDRRKLSFAYG